MRKAYIFKAKLNRRTEANALKWLELCRILYNTAFEQRILLWNQRKISLSWYAQKRELPVLKAEFPEFKAVGSQVLQDVMQRVDRAYKGFYQRLKARKDETGFPRFKGKSRYDSFTLAQSGWKFEGKNLYVANVGRFKLFHSRPIEGGIKTLTIRRSSTGKWFISFSCENVAPRAYPHTTQEIGIDVGIESFLRDSNNRAVENPKFYRTSEKLLRRRQRSLSRKAKGSSHRNRYRILVAKTHERITNQRKDFLHKTANYYIENYKTIYVEDLNIKGMVRNRYLAKSISDCSWGMFFNILCQKVVEAVDREVIKVPPKNSSQVCSCCGFQVHKSLAQRVHHCPNCGLKIDRDLNSALTIRGLGQSLQVLTSAVAVVA